MVKGIEHLNNFYDIVVYAENKIKPPAIISELPQDILEIGPRYTLQRDLEALINWCPCIMSSIEFEQGFYNLNEVVIGDVIKEYYPFMPKEDIKKKVEKIYSFLKDNIKGKLTINEQTMDSIHEYSCKFLKPTPDRIEKYSKVAITLKWLQHKRVKEKLSPKLQKYISMLGDKFGKYGDKEIEDLNKCRKHPFPVSRSNLKVLSSKENYKDLLMGSLEYCEKQVESNKNQLAKYEERKVENIPLDEQYESILWSIKELEDYTEGRSKKDDIKIFEDELLVAIFLIKMQDPLVKKSEELSHFIRQKGIKKYLKYRNACCQ
ncbi:MAG: hypothetical protein IB618_01970 [Candidatus Pacearchaeota archaeon]|nr:MAG: hypothetical protein IB618_01970 [Candidatus Pacearchaeota archaeon]